MFTTQLRIRLNYVALLKRSLSRISAVPFSTSTQQHLESHDYNKAPLAAEIDLMQVDAFGKRFMWNEANFKRLDQEMIYQSKDDDDTGSDKDKHPKGFEKFFKKKE